MNGKLSAHSGDTQLWCKVRYALGRILFFLAHFFFRAHSGDTQLWCKVRYALGFGVGRLNTTCLNPTCLNPTCLNPTCGIGLNPKP